MAKKQSASEADKVSQENEVYRSVFSEIQSFIEVIEESEADLKTAQEQVDKAKAEYEAAKSELALVREQRDGAKHGLYRFLKPANGRDVLPLFDRMEPADEELHGAHSDEWRMKPITALKLSLPSQIALGDADIMLIGQLQDAVMKNPVLWHDEITGISTGSAAAIVDALNAFIARETAK